MDTIKIKQYASPKELHATVANHMTTTQVGGYFIDDLLPTAKLEAINLAAANPESEYSHRLDEYKRAKAALESSTVAILKADPLYSSLVRNVVRTVFNRMHPSYKAAVTEEGETLATASDYMEHFGYLTATVWPNALDTVDRISSFLFNESKRYEKETKVVKKPTPKASKVDVEAVRAALLSGELNLEDLLSASI